MKKFKIGDTVEILSSHTDFYVNHENLKSIFISVDMRGNEYVDPQYLTWMKILPELKYKTFKGRIFQLNEFELDSEYNSYYVQWITKHGIITEWINGKNLKNITARNEPKEI